MRRVLVPCVKAALCAGVAAQFGAIPSTLDIDTNINTTYLPPLIFFTEFIIKFMHILYVAFLFAVWFIVLVCICTFSFLFCWIKRRGKQNEQPLQYMIYKGERLGPLPPVLELNIQHTCTMLHGVGPVH